MTADVTFSPVRLGVNIDHVATIRNARGGGHPDPLRAAHAAIRAGADGITAHLREDRRHISDNDIERLKNEISLPLNLEMAATEEMLAIALRHRPEACCLVPEKREELTTEGGLDVAGGHNHLKPYIVALKEAGIQVSLFIDPDDGQVAASWLAEASVVELHTGSYCEAVLRGSQEDAEREYQRLRHTANLAAHSGLTVHAGHGLDYETAVAVAAIPVVQELNIGHFLVGEALFEGLEGVIKRMRSAVEKARKTCGEELKTS
ncbi:MAG: pyridoxine 5'-phosphate synthase [Parvularculales bacterium]